MSRLASTLPLIPLTEALYKGGIRLLEITYRPDGAVSDEETAANIRQSEILNEIYSIESLVGTDKT
jgi:2-keto-3-deoxy-6-phosphogluconate aldolase